MKNYFSGSVRKSVKINCTKNNAWKKISNIAGLTEWVIDVKKTTYLSRKKTGIGAIRKILFNDGNVVEEHIVAWNKKQSFSYIAVSGLPLRAYHATISINPTRKSIIVTWHSYFNSILMSQKEFSEFKKFLEMFYQKSLKNLKDILEK